jgi:hypothetical protein
MAGLCAGAQLRVVGRVGILLAFLVLFLGGWLALSRTSAPRRPTRPVRS